MREAIEASMYGGISSASGAPISQRCAVDEEESCKPTSYLGAESGRLVARAILGLLWTEPERRLARLSVAV